MNHGRLRSSWATSRSLLGCFSVFESLWVTQWVHDLSHEKALLLTENVYVYLKPFYTNLGAGQRGSILILFELPNSSRR